MQKIVVILRGVILASLIALGVMTIAGCGRTDSSPADKEDTGTPSNTWDELVWDKDNWG